MKVRIRWSYTFTETDTFEEVVEVPDGLSTTEAEAAAYQAAAGDGNERFTPVKKEFPGDPYEEVESCTVVASWTPTTV